MAYKCSQIKIHSFKSHINCQGYGIHVKVSSGSTTARACINILGTSHPELCHHITKQIWEWAEKKDIDIIAAHKPGHKNINADRESRGLLYDLK